MIYTYDYDTRYQPAMPAMQIQIGSFETDLIINTQAIVDSGADGTIIPIQTLARLNVSSEQTKLMRGVAGGAINVALYPVKILVAGQQFPVSAVGDEIGREIIIGRDVLNQMQVTLNGLAHMVEVSQ